MNLVGIDEYGMVLQADVTFAVRVPVKKGIFCSFKKGLK